MSTFTVNFREMSSQWAHSLIINFYFKAYINRMVLIGKMMRTLVFKVTITINKNARRFETFSVPTQFFMLC